MLRYQKELDYIINYYQSEERKRQNLKDRAVKVISKNVNVMKRIQDISASNIKMEIDRRSKSRELRGAQNKIKFCNDM